LAPPQGTFWDFVASLDPSAGIDHTGHPFFNAPGDERPRGRCGGAGRRGGRHGYGHGGPRGHPFWMWAQACNEGNKDGEVEQKDFTPPLDTFTSPSAYTFHLALPGAKREDVGVNYDADKNELTIAGVVYRPGDEEFLKTLQENSERKVGVFERKVKLGGEKEEEIDAETITAKMEDGLLIVTVPRVIKEKEWVDVKKVDIE